MITLLLILAHYTGPVDPGLHAWFDQLSSGKGMCCSFADGLSLKDVDWGMRDGHYIVNLDGKWLDVPPDTVVNDKNRLGSAVVWPYKDAVGQDMIRCFLPGTES